MVNINDEYEYDRSEFTVIPSLEGLHRELIEETIKEQIANPFKTSTDFMDSYSYMLDTILETATGEDNIGDIEYDARVFYQDIIQKIDDRFGLGVNMDVICQYNVEDVRTFAESLYKFFILDYSKNIKKFYTRYILSHQNEIQSALDTNNKKDVTTIAYKKKVSNKFISYALSDLENIISYIRDLSIPNQDFIEYYNQDKLEVSNIEKAIECGIIEGDFVDNFIGKIELGYGYDEIMSNIRNSLFNKGIKK